MSYSEPNTILEINEAHTDNFFLVISKMTSLTYLSSYFQEMSHPAFDVVTPGSTAEDGCGNGPSYDPNTPVTNPPSGTVTCGTTGTSGTADCLPNKIQMERRLRRESNLDHRNFMLYISDVNLPSHTIETYQIGTQFHSISRAGKIKAGELTTTMMISENLLNYNAILYWLYALHNPEEYNKLNGSGMIKEFFTDIYLIITNNHREKVSEYKFLDAFPTSVGDLAMSYKTADKLTTSVSWAHSGVFPTNNFVLIYV